MAKENLQIVQAVGARAGQKILHLKGSLNIQTIFEFQSAVRADTSSVLILDFSEVSFIDSAGLGSLVAAYVAAQKAQRKLAVASLNAQVKALIEMTHVGQVIQSYDTVAKAEEAL